MNTQKFRIISVDPAPSKGSTIFDSIDESFQELDAPHLDKYLKEARQSDASLLVAWDAPLTGPSSLGFFPKEDKKENGASFDFSQFYERKIEKDLREKYGGGKKGNKKIVSVLGYAGCSHWAISRAILGLPRVGRYCLPDSSLPFKLCTAEDQKPKPSLKGHFVVETHPALAMAMLFKSISNCVTALQQYKRKKKGTSAEDRRAAVMILKEAIRNKFSELPESFNTIQNDDELDTFVGFLLARLWITSNTKTCVEIHGTLADGAILLPSANLYSKCNS